MKNVFAFWALCFSISALAVPTAVKLVSPSKIQSMGGTKLMLEFRLPCKKTNVLDTAKVVEMSDDSGDLELALGLVYSESDRECQKDTKLKKFMMEVDVKDFGVTDLAEVEVVKMDIAK